MIDTLGRWLDENLRIPGLPGWASVLVIVVAMAAISVGVTVIALIAIPNDYFCKSSLNAGERTRHPILRWTIRIFRNTVGWFLIIVGVLMLFLPGQGLLTVLIGVMLAEFPGKRRLELHIIRKPKVRNAINSLRQRFGHPPLALDDDECRVG